MRKRTEQDEVVKVREMCGTFLFHDWDDDDDDDGDEDHDGPTVNAIRVREGIERLNTLLATMPPIKVL